MPFDSILFGIAGGMTGGLAGLYAVDHDFPLLSAMTFVFGALMLNMTTIIGVSLLFAASS